MTFLLTKNLSNGRTAFFQNSNLQNAVIDHSQLHMSTVIVNTPVLHLQLHVFWNYIILHTHVKV